METKREYSRLKRQYAVTESVCEHTLPDYNPDVRRVVYTSARVIPGTSFTDGERTELSATVFYDVIYLDGEGKLNHTDFTSDAELVLSTSESVENFRVGYELSGYNVRLTGPRRFSAKASVEANLHATERAEYNIEGDALIEGEPEVATGSLEVMCEVFGVSEEHTHTEDMWMREGAIFDEVKMLISEAHGDVDTVRPCDGGIEVRGAIKIKMLIAAEDECPECVEKSIDFCEIIPLSDKEGEMPEASVTVKALTPTLVATEDGVMARVDLTYYIEAYKRYNERASVIKDCYLKERGTRNEYRDLGYEELIASGSGSIKVNEEMPREGILSSDTKGVIYTSGAFREMECVAEGNTAKIKGKMRISGVACEAFADGTLSYAGVKIDIPIEGIHSFDRPLPEGSTVECRPHLTSLYLTVDDEKLYVTAEIDYHLTAFAEKRSRCIGASVLTDEEISHDPSVITVYYPEKGESLFDIAKRHHTSVLGIASDNSLTESCITDPSGPSSLVGVKKLIIR